MQVSKYLYKHFAQLNCHNLNYGVKITSAVLLQYVKALGFRVLLLLSCKTRCCPNCFAAPNNNAAIMLMMLL